MFRAMALKELREIRGMCMVALVVYGAHHVAAILSAYPVGYVCAIYRWTCRSAIVSRLSTTPSWAGSIFVVRGAWRLRLGLWQTLGESVAGTYPFLLHRPATRRWLIGMKLVVGTVVVPDCAAGSDPGLRPVGGDARHPCQPVRVVDDRADLGRLVGHDAALLWARFSPASGPADGIVPAFCRWRPAAFG